MKKIVIVGGGISGLSTAHYLKEMSASAGHEIDFSLIEKGSRLGGNILTEKEGDFLIEGGPDCFLSEKPWAAQLARHLGLGDQIIPTIEENRGTLVLSNGRLIEMPDGLILMVPTKIMPLVTTPLFSLTGKIRMGMDLFIPKKQGKDDESLGSFVMRRLGKEALDKIAEPLVAGVHAGTPETMSMRASFPKFVEMEEEYGSLIKGMLARMKKAKDMQRASPGPRPTMFMTLRGGLSDLVDAIVKDIPSSSIMLGKGISAIREIRGKYEVNYSIDLEDGSSINADCVILATPAHTAAKLLRSMDAPFSDKLDTIPYVSTATVTMIFKKADIKLPKTFGFVIPRIEGRKIMAATFVSQKFEGRCPDDYSIIRCFVGGSHNEHLVELDDNEMLKMVRQELKDIIKIDAEPVLSRIYRWRKAMPQYTLGHIERIHSIYDSTLRHPGLYLTGSAYNGIGISDSIREGELSARKALFYLFPNRFNNKL